MTDKEIIACELFFFILAAAIVLPVSPVVALPMATAGFFVIRALFAFKTPAS